MWNSNSDLFMFKYLRSNSYSCGYYRYLLSERSLDDAPGVKSVNGGRGQEITGVTLPENG